jgi:hypothetical protein
MGKIKSYYENEVERICTCEGGCSLDSLDHKKKCPARLFLEEEPF